MSTSGGHIVIVLGDNFDADVYHDLRDCLTAAGKSVTVAAISKDIELIDNKGNELISPDTGIGDITGFDFDALVLCDGSVSDDLRTNREFRKLIRRAHDTGMIIGTIDRSVRYLIDAGVAANHFLTGPPDIRYQLEVNGAQYQNEPVWVDGNLISGRLLEDLPAFCSVLIDQTSIRPAA